MSAYEHIKAVYDHTGDLKINTCIANELKVPYEYF